MSKIFTTLGLLLLLLLLGSPLQGQTIPDDGIQKTTFPVDSCLYFMLPFQFRIAGDVIASPGGGQQVNVLFRSTNNPDQLIQGRARFFFNEEDFTGPRTLANGVTGTMMMTPPESPENEDNWPGGQPPFPMLLSGFVQTVDGNPMDPWQTITVRVNRVYFEELTE